ncbi:acyclic terpene utilization AtuA family protein [Novosphingobium sp. FSY-8]|uniref:Acyclic terpene utilization AtuA family protein n=1 Tax=Novosphingobium ovatum TaxID=1908523 RepID=A0ABW9XGW9_9SPHN|nr:acyclic terpene utilization AtuA family protein [Novosphingobium ovatum]NBC37797.1 acyclic terpene utilization AtuA family protein [Novosphingobium ovatum]
MGRASIRIGAGAGFSGDRIDPAVELITRGELDFLCFECLAERTIALAQLARAQDPDGGYDPLLKARMRACLPEAVARGVRIVTNMGAANPLAAMRAALAEARDLGLHGLRMAAVLGDDVLQAVTGQDLPLIDRPGRLGDIAPQVVSANAYLGAFPIARALDQGAQVVFTGRVCDPALFLGPMIHAFGWAVDDWTRLGRGTAVGHLLECAGQLTGGYFADPGVKDVADLARLGFPLAVVEADGHATLTKVAGTGGCLTVATAKEQLMYEILDPAAYRQADVVADFTGITLTQTGPDQVRVTGADGRARPAEVKVSVGYRDGFIGEGQISYAGQSAVARGELAIAIIRERLALLQAPVDELRCDLIGVNAANVTAHRPAPAEVRVRIAGRAASAQAARIIPAEVDALYLNGPAGGGGVTTSLREVVAVASVLLPQGAVVPTILHEVA